ncbi:uncharacterized protein KY384_000713 [Bacidia gigantensis]|uniref:uncharacterized protein n=1 Tax=Bacidia gigantensis TaxID=2732470 RepID=UPI001D054C86|nr:uncharacterized protein KY384_000713 [Bacidia gigantensis]KAG8525951.1 hypothetical protein KY384_000713 [Bacidia gigantensis]
MSQSHLNQIRGSAPLKFLVIGAGSRGNGYAHALLQSTPDAQITAVAEPIEVKRRAFGRQYIWGEADAPAEWQSFADWKDFLGLQEQRQRAARDKASRWSRPVDGVFICTLDDSHCEIITAFAPLGYHIMSEKPLATTLQDCLKIYRSLRPQGSSSSPQIFSIGHVLHYSPHNILLRRLLLDDEAIGDILSVEHTEPVGWWHFAHSYVRGNWRKEASSAPSLLTKSCHDIDLLMWLLCAPPATASITDRPPHLPSFVSSTGSLLYFKPSRKPQSAGGATNCYSCAAEPQCIYSARKIYVRDRFDQGHVGWPVKIVDSEIEDMYVGGNKKGARERLEARLKDDYNESTSSPASRPWYGRCVYNADNDVCDDQVVTINWEDDPLPVTSVQQRQDRLQGRGAKNAIFHMVASTEAQCERRGHISGTRGEIEYDSRTIRVYDFATKRAEVHVPEQPGGGHGGGDAGLVSAFFKAVEAVKLRQMPVEEAQQAYVGCTAEEIVRNTAMVFAAEEARREKKVVDWPAWWQNNVEIALEHQSG